MGKGAAGGTAMIRLYATISERGEVTIPEDVRQLLGLRPHDKVTFAIVYH